MTNTRVYVLDRIGWSGARWGVGGAVDWRGGPWRGGIWVGPELTAEKFVPDPFGG